MTKEQIFEQARAGYVLVIEPDSAFLDEGCRNIGCDRPRIVVDYATAIAASTSGKMEMMTDAEVIERVRISPTGRFFFAWRGWLS